MVDPLSQTMINGTYRWYAMYIRSRREKEVERDLSEDGYEVFLPATKKLRQWSDRKKWVEMPLFPGYCFVKVSHKEYFSVLQHPGVVKYVSFGGNAAPVPDRQLEAIKRVLGENLDFEVTTDRFKPGEKVEIGVGPMSGYEGEIVRIEGKKQFLLRVGDIGYSLLVKVPVAFVE